MQLALCGVVFSMWGVCVRVWMRYCVWMLTSRAELSMIKEKKDPFHNNNDDEDEAAKAEVEKIGGREE